MVCRKKFISIWNEIKKFPSFIGKTIAVDQLNDTTAFPWFLNFFKNLSADYRKCKSNRWDYLISIHDLISNELVTPNEKNLIDKRIYLINKYNERLLFYSSDKTNPWVIDDRDETNVVLYRKNYLEFEKKITFIISEEIKNGTFSQEINFNSIQHEIHKIKRQQEKKIKNVSVGFLKEAESIRIYSITSWEKINKFVIKNKVMQFLSLLWYGISCHANLLNWISFLLIFFSLSLYSYPIIFLLLGISLASYLILRSFYLVKKDSGSSGISTDEAERILEFVKIEVFNEEKIKNEFKLIHETVFDFSKKNININELFASISSIQKKIDSIYYPSLEMHQSKLYQYLMKVYPKTQFIASLTINLTSIILYTYLLTWAIQGCLTILGAVSLAAIISSSITVGILILIVAGVFLIHHLCEFLSREGFYQRTILNKLNEICTYYYKDEYGRQCFIELPKWRKFEYLQANIDFLASELTNFFEKNNPDNLNNKLYSLFNSYMLKKNVYNSYEEDKILGNSDLFFKKLKKFLNRFFAFSGGGFYGYNLTQQIVWKSNLGMHALVKTLTLPILLIFIPLIIINGIANLITYHLHSRQRNRFEMIRNLDNRIEVLEQTNKKLLFLASLLSIELKHSSASAVNLNADSESISSRSKNFSFFKETHQKINTNQSISSSMLNVHKI